MPKKEYFFSFFKKSVTFKNSFVIMYSVKFCGSENYGGRKMRLKNIEMQGFKSFADKIYLDFNSGITAIVGPNGSGKSNISDAIRWVMGEQSIKSLRGSRMEDVIFAGTEARKALGFAEVTLVLDNTDGYFPLDFPEITVSRRVYRSGEGEYYINKTLCRLKDIHELFMDTGLGRDGYSIIGQGKIDNILSTKSEDRRQIFEEAAGISKYKYRKIEAERKLAQTEENLTRVRDILAELETQIGPLSRQSEKAKKYLVLRDELRGLDINASIINIDKIKTEQEQLIGDIDILNSQIDLISKELAETDEKIGGMYDMLKACDEEIAALSEAERAYVSDISEAEKSIGIFKNDIQHNLENIERLNIEINHILENIELFDKELEEHKKHLAELNDENVKITAELDEVTAQFENMGKNVGEKGGLLYTLKSDIINLETEAVSLRGAIENIQILTDNFNERKKEIETEKADRASGREELTKNIDVASAEEQKLLIEVRQKEEELRKRETELKDKKAEFSSLQEKKNNSVLELNQKRSRRTMLMDMEREFEGYAKGVKGVMNAYNDGEFKNATIYGPLAQLIKTDKKYITAIETALGAAGQNIVTKTEEEAKKAIFYLKEKHLGRATFLPVSSIKGKNFDKSGAEKCNGFISVASELVECDAEFKNIVSSLLGTTVICEDIDTAVAMAKKNGHKFRIVTLSGDVIQSGGAMTGGSTLKTTGSLSRTGEIDALQKDIQKLKQETEAQDKKIDELVKQIQEYENITETLNLSIAELKGEAVLKSADKQKYQALLENIVSSDTQLEKEIEQIDLRITELNRDSEQKLSLIKQKNSEKAGLEIQVEKLEEEYGRLSSESERIANRITELNIKKSTILKDVELENERISDMNSNKGEQIEAVNVKRGGIEMLKERNASIEKEIQDLKESCEELKKKSSESRDKVSSVNETRIKTEGDIRAMQNKVKDAQEKRFTLTGKADRLTAKNEKLTYDKENIINRMWEDYELTYSDALELKADDSFDFNAATIRIKELKESIKELGNINIDAIEEYKNVKERFDFMTVQTQDLEKAKAELDSVIKEMMELMQTRFAEQFEIINRNFSRVFGELFGGGRANLTLSEPDNVLESGIEIEAQPPGKKLQSLTLLSGGERAFTAIALLFAILDVRPTPFCILDEIEAALDDVNVYRFADYLSKYSKKTQFIVVTHRRGTMEAANILYGVTMQERGISKLLSLNIDEIKE